MYEFTKKEIREKFKKTKYGKKVNKYFTYSLIIMGILCFISGFVYGFVKGSEIELTNNQESLKSSLEYATMISIILAIYFEGKRDGAIEQFKINLKK